MISLIFRLVVVGGDGSFTGLVGALLHRCMRESGRDVNDREATLAKPSLPIGIIPCGMIVAGILVFA